MMRKFMTFVATALFAVATLTPMEASAQRRHHGEGDTGSHDAEREDGEE